MKDMTLVRAWWAHRQCLTSNGATQTASQVLESAGWARSVGGANPYLTLFCRAGIGFDEASIALQNLEIHELPCARGCTYVVPQSHYSLALKVGQGFSDEAAMNTARKFLGVTDAEVQTLMTAIEDALKPGPLEPRDLKSAVGDAARNLGEEGKKRGQTTTLSLGLGFLQSQGRIRRVPTNGRLDQQRYAYMLWDPSPLADFELSREEAFAELARNYFTWAAPATLGHFQWFSGLGVKASKDAIASLKLKELDSGYLLPTDLWDEYSSFQTPNEPDYRLVASIDSHFLLRREVISLFADEDRSRQMVGEKGEATLGIQELTNHAILDRGRIVGIWEYDVETQSIVWVSFVGSNESLRKAIQKTEEFVRDQLGDARSFSLDSPESRKPKIAALRAMASN